MYCYVFYSISESTHPSQQPNPRVYNDEESNSVHNGHINAARLLDPSRWDEAILAVRRRCAEIMSLRKLS
jgi:hypothetical protein